MNKPTILVIEDNPTTRKLFCVALETENYQVLEAEDAKTALALCRQQKPDLILQDLILPDMDGLELNRQLRLIPQIAEIPILAVSGFLNCMEEAIEKNSGFTAYLLKPVEITHLLEAIQTYLPTSTPAHKNQTLKTVGYPQRHALQSAQIALINCVAHTLIHNANIEDALKEVLNSCLDAAGIARAAFYLLKEDNFILQQAIGYPTLEKKQLDNFFGQPQLLSQIQTKRTSIAIPPSENSDAIGKAFLKATSVTSALIIPLLSGEHFLGVLFLGSNSIDITRGDIHVFTQSLASQIAQAIALATAFQRIRNSESKLEQTVKERTQQLQTTNKELESFSYSVSHDLRAPLRSIDGFSQLLEKNYSNQLDSDGKDYLIRIHHSVDQMGQLIDGLLKLSQVTRAELVHQNVNLTNEVDGICKELKEREPLRQVEFTIAANINTSGDPQLLRIMLENLLNNAWKFTAKQPVALIEFGTTTLPNNKKAFYVRDNGVGFDMANSNKLFCAFQRLHSMKDFPGHGIGLATVARIIHRHGGEIWATSAVNQGATFYFVL